MSAAEFPTTYYLVICKDDKSPMVQLEAESIERELSRLIGTAVSNNVAGEKLQFNETGLVTEGFFFVDAANEEAMNWLLSQKIKPYYCRKGYNYNIDVQIKKLERRICLTCKTDASIGYSDEKIFRVQNQHLKHLMIDEWNFIVKKGRELVVSVPEKVVNQIDKSVKIYYETSMIGPTLQHLTSKLVFDIEIKK